MRNKIHLSHFLLFVLLLIGLIFDRATLKALWNIYVSTWKQSVLLGLLITIVVLFALIVILSPGSFFDTLKKTLKEEENKISREEEERLREEDRYDNNWRERQSKRHPKD